MPSMWIIHINMHFRPITRIPIRDIDELQDTNFPPSNHWSELEPSKIICLNLGELRRVIMRDHF
jgi:hypothetical protein